jgi:protein-disulfide isomerase
MSKRQEIRERRRREQIRNRIIVIVLVVVGAFLVAFTLILPSINNVRNAAKMPVLEITPSVYSTKVDGVHLGDPNAPVKLDVYSDFRCSACLFFTQNIEPTIIQNYVETGKVYYTAHSFITIDSYDGTNASLQSANAALCASEQNRYWDYHATLYANQTSESAALFTDARLVKMAENLKLDMEAFNSCFKAKKYNSEVQKDIAQGQSLEVAGTPSVFVDGIFVPSFQQTAQAIDDALAGK